MRPRYMTAAIQAARALPFTLLIATGCSPTWTRLTPVPAPSAPQVNRRVQVWTHDNSVYYWYAVTISEDSVSGVSYRVRGDLANGSPMPVKSDTTRHRLPLAEVDSIRLARYNPANNALLAADLTFIVLYTALSKCHDPLGCT